MHPHQNLIDRLKEKDQEAFAKLYDAYSGAIYGVIIQICKSEVMAQEVLQDTFLAVWNNAGTYDAQKASFYTWLYRIARNKALNAVRNSQTKVIQNQESGVYESSEEEQKDDNFADIKGSLEKLKPHHRKAIELIYFNGYTHREAYQEMDVPLGTFKSYIRQALKQLKENYQKISILLLALIHVLR
ncbi:MAG: RNA polymerase subunit sigma-24 [Flavobacteriaceae bacterium]|nr:RNA polymerase subunit sigma-24 [Flavobacteriaceae bacterium]|tara:strand:+ start:40722 stop:41279 length:558 start_codon:yes stop_codon:yes gene_type:complete